MEQAISEKLQIIGSLTEEAKEILTPEAVEFIVTLHEKFNNQRVELLKKRMERQKMLDAGEKLNFLSETKDIREGNWTIAPLPDDLKDRRVEITGPAVDRKMVINALNSGAKIFMACFEDASTPTWENMIAGQINMRDSVRRTIEYTHPGTGKKYVIKDKPAVLMVRPRGLHLDEKHVLVNGVPVSGGFFDFGLYFYHNAKETLSQGTGPYFYLPKLESHLEARLWNDIFKFAQDYLKIPQGTIKATVLIETILAAFEMDEILYELKEHSAGLNCGRWDYIFSFIKRLRNQPDVIMPDRGQVTMTVPFMRAYTLLCIKTCHKRNAPAIGGMAAQIPVKDDEHANWLAFEKVREDKYREATDGHDGTWVAHPGLVSVAMEQFDAVMKTLNQIDKKREDVHVTAIDLLAVPQGTITEEGLQVNTSVGVQYIASWLRGNGAAPINNLMEDAATAEISRTQVWQWVRHPKGILEDGRKVTMELVFEVLEEELVKIKQSVGDQTYNEGRYDEAAELFKYLIRQDEFIEFLTLPGYEKIN
nr:malate synthase A [Lysinibacillus timonensis]